MSKELLTFIEYIEQARGISRENIVKALESAITLNGDKAEIKEAECIECGACVGSCPCEAITL